MTCWMDVRYNVMLINSGYKQFISHLKVVHFPLSLRSSNLHICCYELLIYRKSQRLYNKTNILIF